jgi:HMG (high mobility group) box
MHRSVENPSRRRKRSPVAKPVTRPSKPGYIPRPLNCFFLFRLDYLSQRKGGPSRGAGSLSEEVANAWRALHSTERLRWEKEAEKHREKHAVQKQGSTFKPTVRRCKRKNVKVNRLNEHPDVVNTPGSRDPATSLSSLPDCLPDIMRCREFLRLPCWDDSVLTSTNRGLHLPLQSQGRLACGVPESVCRRSSSAPIPSAARVAHSADTWTDPTLANRDPLVLPTHLNHHPSYSGIRPGIMPADLFSPTRSQHSLHHERLTYPTESSVKQDETPELFERYQKVCNPVHRVSL